MAGTLLDGVGMGGEGLGRMVSEWGLNGIGSEGAGLGWGGVGSRSEGWYQVGWRKVGVLMVEGWVVGS